MAHTHPTVLFVCNTNGGKSQMAAALATLDVPHVFTAISAGLTLADAVNGQAAASLAKIGADMASKTPTQLTDDMQRSADVVVPVGDAATPELEGVKYVRWNIIDPSVFGAKGDARMDKLRDDLRKRVNDLAGEFGTCCS